MNFANVIIPLQYDKLFSLTYVCIKSFDNAIRITLTRDCGLYMSLWVVRLVNYHLLYNGTEFIVVEMWLYL